jgi:uncharacterized membrane protein YeaQ/YmgE (transglycosylase-associated protein family)
VGGVAQLVLLLHLAVFVACRTAGSIVGQMNVNTHARLVERRFTMGIIGTIFIGLIVGLIARFIKPGDDSMGWIMTILLGVGGSFAATYGGQALGIYKAGQAAGFIGAVLGAVVLLVIYGLVSKK